MGKDKLTFNIDEDMKMELKILAIKQKRTVTEILNEIIEVYLNENK